MAKTLSELFRVARNVFRRQNEVFFQFNNEQSGQRSVPDLWRIDYYSLRRRQAWYQFHDA